jgi:endo-1,4-beta-xylanase
MKPFNNIMRIVTAATMLMSMLQCSPRRHATTSSGKGLKDHYSQYFPIGVAVSPQALKTAEADLILKEFNSLTAENAMKMGPIHPQKEKYFWAHADSIAAFARQHGLKLRGHTLCWHSQTPGWLFTDNNQRVSKEELLKRLKEHITNVVTRYKDVIYAWDVVNEAISDRRDEYLRNSPWLQICGEEFIEAAFRYAHEADPKAMLFYNDYNEIDPVKRSKIIRLVKSLQQKGVPIHGIGLQAHWAVNEPSATLLDSTLKDFAATGLSLQITELDISVYRKEHEARGRAAADTDTSFSAIKEQAQIQRYKEVFELFRKYRRHISGITFWNVSDRYSWLDNFPVRNRKDHPLLFDAALQRKRAYEAVVDF